MSDKLEYIDDFFKSELDAEQLELFEKRILEDADFADELAFYLSSVYTLRQGISREKKEHFRTLLNKESKPELKNSSFMALYECRGRNCADIIKHLLLLS